MPLEALLWTLLMLLAPIIARRSWGSIQNRFGRFAPEFEALAPWIHGVGLPYLAVILGSVSGRLLGLQGTPPDRWFTASIACCAGLGAAVLLRSRFPHPLDPQRSVPVVLLDEVRWAFYRGAAGMWLSFPLSILLGLGIALIDMVIPTLITEGRLAPKDQYLKTALSATLSAVLFSLSRNFWITLTTQMLLVPLMLWQPTKNTTPIGDSA